jgi:hypothetical protein
MTTGGRAGGAGKGKREDGPARLLLDAMGLEAEFTIVVDGLQTRPEDVFGDPREFLSEPQMHRVGTSYHLPNGGAVYFDTGVVEIVTPAIELDRGAAVRAGRSLWENIELVRSELDRWERRTARRVQLAGFSTHYNVSVDASGPLDRLARLLTYILPAPVMLLAANRRSTGIGVRPRAGRIEVTADFTPDAALQVAAATLITGIVRDVARWPNWSLASVRRRGLPLLAGFAPCPHTTRRGWLARYDCYPRSPFTTAPNDRVWQIAGESPRPMSLREIALQVFRRFRVAIARAADPFSLRLIAAVLDGRATSLLDLPDRPATYDDVGRLCRWDTVFPARFLRRSRYERVLMLAIAGTPIELGGEPYRPTAMRGWSQVVLTHLRTRDTRVIGVDALLPHLERWERE